MTEEKEALRLRWAAKDESEEEAISSERRNPVGTSVWLMVISESSEHALVTRADTSRAGEAGRLARFSLTGRGRSRAREILSLEFGVLEFGVTVSSVPSPVGCEL